MDITIRDLADACETLTQYREICHECGTDLYAEEENILSVSSEFLPLHAQAVRDGGVPTPDYWRWIADQTVTAQESIDLQIALERGE